MYNKARGNVGIQGLWKRGKTCILDIYVKDTDAEVYKELSLRTVLEAAAQVKKAKYLKACLEQQHTFVPFAYSVNNMAGVNALAFKKRIASLLAEK